ncbi:MAG: MBL fold metallo-hydrolase, partial [Candidatus Hodarchaeales archaeon]
TGFGGLNEIGGNQFLLEAEGSRLWLDFGLNFVRQGQYYTDYLKPRKYRMLQDLLLFGLLPSKKGLYREDFVKRMTKEPEPLAFDGAIFSHAHWDHVGFIPLLRPDLPLWCGETAHLILSALEMTSMGMMSAFTSYREEFAMREKKRGGPGLTVAKPPREPRDIRTFRTGDSIDIGAFHIQPVHVDHSIPGAYGFIIDVAGKTIGYTGDFRFHGPRADMTGDFIYKARECGVDVLLCEGTRISQTNRITEKNVRNEVSEKVRETTGLVLANFPQRDIDRLRTFWQAARENDRILVVSTKQALLLSQLEQDKHLYLPGVDDANIGIYVKRKGWGVLGNETYPPSIRTRGYASWEREFLDRANTLTETDIQQNQQDYILFCSFYDLAELANIQPGPGSHYIRSITEAFTDELEIDQQREEAWLKHFGLWPMTQIHASGHASGPEIQKLIERIDPGLLIPIHTEAPEEFLKLHSNVEILERGQPSELQ